MPELYGIDPNEIFVPSGVIEDPKLFVGRSKELNQAQRALRQPGASLLIFGDRGLGKTTFVHQLELRSKDHFVWIDCDKSLGFVDLINLIFQKLGIESTSVEKTKETEAHGRIGGKGPIVGGEASKTYRKKETSQLSKLSQHAVSPIADHFEEIDVPTVIVLDEFDSIRTGGNQKYGDLCLSLAHLLKSMARRSARMKVKFIIVGVAISSMELLGEHVSLERHVKEIYVDRIKIAQLREFLTEAEFRTKIHFSPDSREHFLVSASGYPYFLHLVGLECMHIARERQQSTIDFQLYEEGFDACYNQTYRSFLTRYRHANDELDKYQRAILFGMSLDRKPLVTVDATVSQWMQDTELNTKKNREKLKSAAESLASRRLFLFKNSSQDAFGFIDPLMKHFFRERYHLKKNRRAKGTKAKPDQAELNLF